MRGPQVGARSSRRSPNGKTHASKSAEKNPQSKVSMNRPTSGVPYRIRAGNRRFRRSLAKPLVELTIRWQCNLPIQSRRLTIW